MTTCLRLCQLSKHYNHLTGTKLSLQPARQHCKLTRQAPALLDFLGWHWYHICKKCSRFFRKSIVTKDSVQDPWYPCNKLAELLTGHQVVSMILGLWAPNPVMTLCDVKCVKCCNDSKLQEAVTRPQSPTVTRLAAIGGEWRENFWYCKLILSFLGEILYRNLCGWGGASAGANGTWQ